MIRMEQGHENKVCGQTLWLYKETTWAHGTRAGTGVLPTSFRVGAVLPNDSDIKKATIRRSWVFYHHQTQEGTWSLLVGMSSSLHPSSLVKGPLTSWPGAEVKAALTSFYFNIYS